ncbi:ER to Golgi transport-related protein [Pseudozyma hubeiensis SY62]|uniref:ER to Golgi transport-related protein n=1 Tax=Pseudozyma hubeiensis (strain SY62) TaxID=1305764 RepID=R9NWR2_PSEHS|nr:ER to Golgi transport-related protein [Pseudozyma hubeiensis SY62]GAC92984.1 ER to Golgi transport-related protein [Pseudozyma hubeiensis SY62]
MSRRPLAENVPTAAPHVSVVRRPLGPSTKSNVVPTTTSAAAPTHAIKTQLKIEDRLIRAESRIQDLQHEKVTVQNELGDLQTELRLAAQREAKLKHSLEKWEKSHAALKEKSSKLSDLQSRLGELHRVHEESKARRQKEIDELTEKLHKEEERRKHDTTEAAHAVAAEKARARELQTRYAAIESELEALRLQGTASHDVLKQKQSLIDDLQAQRDSDKIIAIDAQKYARRIEVELTAQIQQLKAEIEAKSDQAAQIAHEQQAVTDAARSELESRIDDLLNDMDDIEQQHTHNLAMVAKAVSMHIGTVQQRLELDKDSLRSMWHANATERIKIETVAEERAAQIHELVAVVKQVQQDRDSAKQLATTLEADLDSIAAELAAERRLASRLIEQQEERQQRSSVGESSSWGDLSGLTEALDIDAGSACSVRAELEDALARNALLQDEAAELQARCIARSTEAKSAEEALAATRSQVATLEASIAAKTREIDTLVQQLSEIEPLRKRLATATEQASSARKEADTQSEACRSLAASLQNARVAEKAWRDDRDRMASMLNQAEHYEALYNELVEQTKHLVQRNALAEEQVASLSALNSELLSHNNPNQKIMYMDRVRHELDDVKHENIDLRWQLERAQEENRVLQRELVSYRAVDAPLSQRPRAEVTRVMRAGDHEGLLRQVSGSLEQPTRATFGSAATMVGTPVRSTFATGPAKTPFSVQGPRFTAEPLQADLVKSLSQDVRQQPAEPVQETYETGAEASSHPPLPMDTGLSPKKRRSYGSLSVYAAEARPEQGEQVDDQGEPDDDTLLPLPTATDADEDHERAVRRNRPRHTLVNSGALRVGQQQPSSIPVATPVVKSESTPAIPGAATITNAGNGRRPSLTTSSLGIKARRVSELVRASTPPLPSIADFSSLETPNHLLTAALPSPSLYGLADWTATDETSHVPGLNPHRGPFAPSSSTGLTHSTPLPAPSAKRPKSRYSNAQRIPSTTIPDSSLSITPRAPLSLLSNRKPARVQVAEAGQTTYEDEHDSFRNGWLYDDRDDDVVDLPDFSIEDQKRKASTAAGVKKVKSKAKSRHSMKLVKSGPMARTFFR